MVKPRRAKKIAAASSESPIVASPHEDTHALHTLTCGEIAEFRRGLLRWYDKNKRELPWRTVAAQENDPNIRAYAVLVSEVMLQQTQVSTVVTYYNKWMTRWPTLGHLALATSEQVHEMWAGLGYYSRGRRLHEIACKVQKEMAGEMPTSPEELVKLPGVGPYTAGAVASIAFANQAPVVDGNVIRVMSRLRAIGACTTTPTVTKAMWQLAEKSVDPERPGDFNQALMELGATVCTPKNPHCDECPVSSACLARKRAHKTASRAELADIEEAPGCTLCLATTKWDPSLGVMNYPRKEKKTNVSQQQTAVCVVHRDSQLGVEFFMEKRPKEGLLANMWQFPCVPLPLAAEDSEALSLAQAQLRDIYKISDIPVLLLGRVPHQFSHISQVYVVCSVKLRDVTEPSSPAQAQQWVLHSAISQLAISTAMKKVFKLFMSKPDSNTEVLASKKRKAASLSPQAASKKNKLVTDFFKKDTSNK